MQNDKLSHSVYKARVSHWQILEPVRVKFKDNNGIKVKT